MPLNLREAARLAVLAQRAGDAYCLERALRELDRLYWDDVAHPADLPKMLKSILLQPYRGGE